MFREWCGMQMSIELELNLWIGWILNTCIPLRPTIIDSNDVCVCVLKPTHGWHWCHEGRRHGGRHLWLGGRGIGKELMGSVHLREGVLCSQHAL